jgi:radical SAM superfamily enzyme YgiQ (UPF0313 family)
MNRTPEEGTIRKDPGSSLQVALVYPNAYRIGMGNLGFQHLYKYLNSLPGLSAERFFFPESSRGKTGYDEKPLSRESGRPLSSFPIIAFSVPFESDYPAIPGALLSAGIPPMQQDRGPYDQLVLAGGVSVSMNPEPPAPFLDLVFIGELPEQETAQNEGVKGLFDALMDLRSRSVLPIRDRDGLLAALREIPGVYIPSACHFEYGGDGLISAVQTRQGFPTAVEAVKRKSGDEPVPISAVFSSEAEFGENLLVETNRGCGRGCRYCAAGWIHFPVRHRAFHLFRKDVDRAINEGRTIGLIGSDLAGHPQLEEILTRIVARGGKFSLSSIRPEGLTPEVIRLLAQTGQKTATLAPEVGSERMKTVIGKKIPSERFLELVELLVTAGIPNVRFYFMIGLPTETDDDAQAIVDFVRKAQEVFVRASKPKKKIGRIGVQVNPFVPKPWTPFQWAAMAAAKTLEQRIRIIRNGLKRLPNVKIRVESVRQAGYQAFLSRGDRRTAGVILRVATQSGKWSGAFKKEQIDPDFFAHRERLGDEIFPWDVVDHGVSKERLWQIFSSAMKSG